MLLLIPLILSWTTIIQARVFDNPILGDTDNRFPGAIKVNGTYYVVTAPVDQNGNFPIHSSTDLISWNPAGYVFKGGNGPTWVRVIYLDPIIHKIGSNYQVYFLGHLGEGKYAAGVAIASHPLGPYTPIDRPILSIPEETIHQPRIINDGDKLYLMWSNRSSIKAQEMNANGLSFSSDQTTVLLSPTLTWENDTLQAPWYFHRGDYHYLMYSGNNVCSENNSGGVARSRNAMGPYEKLANPFLVSNSVFNGTGHISLVKDLDEKTDLVVFQAYRKEVGCSHLVLLATIGWDEDNWPYVQDF